MNLELVRKGHPYRVTRRPKTVVCANRAEHERGVTGQAATRHQEWLARASSRPPDLWHRKRSGCKAGGRAVAGGVAGRTRGGAVGPTPPCVTRIEGVKYLRGR